MYKIFIIAAFIILLPAISKAQQYQVYLKSGYGAKAGPMQGEVYSSQSECEQRRIELSKKRGSGVYKYYWPLEMTECKKCKENKDKDKTTKKDPSYTKNEEPYIIPVENINTDILSYKQLQILAGNLNLGIKLPDLQEDCTDCNRENVYSNFFGMSNSNVRNNTNIDDDINDYYKNIFGAGQLKDDPQFKKIDKDDYWSQVEYGILKDVFIPVTKSKIAEIKRKKELCSKISGDIRKRIALFENKIGEIDDLNKKYLNAYKPQKEVYDEYTKIRRDSYEHYKKDVSSFFDDAISMATDNIPIDEYGDYVKNRSVELLGKTKIFNGLLEAKPDESTLSLAATTINVIKKYKDMLYPVEKDKMSNLYSSDKYLDKIKTMYEEYDPLRIVAKYNAKFIYDTEYDKGWKSKFFLKPGSEIEKSDSKEGMIFDIGDKCFQYSELISNIPYADIILGEKAGKISENIEERSGVAKIFYDAFRIGSDAFWSSVKEDISEKVLSGNFNDKMIDIENKMNIFLSDIEQLRKGINELKGCLEQYSQNTGNFDCMTQITNCANSALNSIRLSGYGDEKNIFKIKKHQLLAPFETKILIN